MQFFCEKAIYFQLCPTNNLGNLLGIPFSMVWYTRPNVETNEISATSGRWELVSAPLLQISWKKEAGQSRNLPKCPKSKKTNTRTTHLSRKGHPLMEVSCSRVPYTYHSHRKVSVRVYLPLRATKPWNIKNLFLICKK